jgi:hypothetical protein
VENIFRDIKLGAAYNEPDLLGRQPYWERLFIGC